MISHPHGSFKSSMPDCFSEAFCWRNVVTGQRLRKVPVWMNQYIMTPECVMSTRGGRTCCTFWTLPLGHWWWSNLWNRFVLVLHQTSGRYQLTVLHFWEVEVYFNRWFPSYFPQHLHFCPGKTATGIAGAQTSEAQPLYSRAPGTGQRPQGFHPSHCLGSHFPGIAEVSVHVHDFKLSFSLRRFFVQRFFSEPSFFLEFPTSHKSCWFEQSWFLGS